MTKMFATVVLASVLALGAVAACHSKKPAPLPPMDKTSPETGATGGAAYGGQKAGAPAEAPGKDPTKPDAPH